MSQQIVEMSPQEVLALVTKDHTLLQTCSTVLAAATIPLSQHLLEIQETLEKLKADVGVADDEVDVADDEVGEEGVAGEDVGEEGVAGEDVGEEGVAGDEVGVAGEDVGEVGVVADEVAMTSEEVGEESVASEEVGMAGEEVGMTVGMAGKEVGVVGEEVGVAVGMGGKEVGVVGEEVGVVGFVSSMICDNVDFPSGPPQALGEPDLDSTLLPGAEEEGNLSSSNSNPALLDTMDTNLLSEASGVGMPIEMDVTRSQSKVIPQSVKNHPTPDTPSGSASRHTPSGSLASSRDEKAVSADVSRSGRQSWQSSVEEEDIIAVPVRSTSSG